MSETNQIALSEKQKEALSSFGLGTESSKEEAKVIDDKKEELAEEKKEVVDEKQIAAPEITEEMILAHLKSKGLNISTLEELKPKETPEDEKKRAEQKEAEKLSFGLQKGLFNRNQYESFISDRKDKVGLVYTAELNDAKAKDPEWNEDKEVEFKAEFEEEFGLSLDPSSPKYQRGQKKLAIIHESILNQTYSPILSLDKEFSAFEADRQREIEKQQTILKTAPIYKKDVEDILSTLNTISVPLGTDKFDVPVSKEMLTSVQEMLLDEKFVSEQILAGHKKETLAQVATNLLITESWQQLAFEAAKQYRSKHEKGLRGIPEGGKLEKPLASDENLSEKQKEALNHFKGNPAIIAN